MPTALPTRSALILLAALSLALAFGLLATGPLAVPAAPATPDRATALVCLLLLVPALGGAWALRRAPACPLAMRRPLALFFGLALAYAPLAAWHHLAPSPVGLLLVQAVMVLGCGAVMLAFLAERVDVAIGGRAACALVAVLGLGAVVLAASPLADLRGLVFLQALPLLLLPAGLRVAPGRFTQDTQWIVLGCLYAATQAAALLGLPLAMHLGLWLVLAWAAWGLVWGASRRQARLVQPAAAGDSLRHTSLNTAG